MMRDVILDVNGFKVDSKILPKRIYKFSFIPNAEKITERYREIDKLNAVPLSPVEEIIVDVVSWEKPSVSDSRVRKVEEATLDDLSDYGQERLVRKFLECLGLTNLLRRNFPLQIKRSEEYIQVPDIKKRTIKKIGKEFYLFADIGYYVKPMKNIYELIEEGRISVKSLIGKEIIFDPFREMYKNGKTIKVVDVDENPSREDIQFVLEYCRLNYGIEKLPLQFPILKVKFAENKKFYLYHPCLCYLKVDVPSYECVISNNERKRILEDTVSSIAFLEKRAISLAGVEYKSPAYLVRTKEGQKRVVNSLRETIKHPPFFVPEFLIEQEKIPIFVLVDKKLPKNYVNKFILSQLENGHLRLKRGNFEIFKTIRPANRRYIVFDVDFNDFSIPEEIREKINGYKLSFALCLFSEMSEEKYDYLKMKLFSNNIVSQFVDFNKWNSGQSHFISRVLAFNIYTKLGIRPFSLAKKFEYDVIIGIDIGNDSFNRRSKAGGVTVFLSDGTIKSLYPVSVEAGGEKIEYLDRFLEIVAEKLDLYGSRILFLRDGRGFREEADCLSCSYAVKNRKLEVELVNVKKGHSMRILSDKGSKGVVIRDDLALLLPHSTKGARSLLIDSFFRIRYGEVDRLPITEKLLETLFRLTKLNFSTIYAEQRALRLPAPLHYSDLYVKALRRNWPVNQYLLEMGALYFI